MFLLLLTLVAAAAVATLYILLFFVTTIPRCALRPAERGVCLSLHRTLLVAKVFPSPENKRTIYSPLVRSAIDDVLLQANVMVTVVLNREAICKTQSEKYSNIISLFDTARSVQTHSSLSALVTAITDDATARAAQIPRNRVFEEGYAKLTAEAIRPGVEPLARELVKVDTLAVEEALRSGAGKSTEEFLCALMRPAFFSSIRKYVIGFYDLIEPHLQDKEEAQLRRTLRRFAKASGDGGKNSLDIYSDIEEVLGVQLPKTASLLRGLLSEDGETTYDDLTIVISAEVGRCIGQWLSDILNLKKEDRPLLEGYLESYAKFMQVQQKRLRQKVEEGHEAVDFLSDEIVKPPPTLARVLSVALKRTIRDNIVHRLHGSPFFQTIEAIGNRLVENTTKGSVPNPFSPDELPPRDEENVDGNKSPTGGEEDLKEVLDFIENLKRQAKLYAERLERAAQGSTASMEEPTPEQMEQCLESIQAVILEMYAKEERRSPMGSPPPGSESTNARTRADTMGQRSRADTTPRSRTDPGPHFPRLRSGTGERGAAGEGGELPTIPPFLEGMRTKRNLPHQKTSPNLFSTLQAPQTSSGFLSPKSTPPSNINVSSSARLDTHLLQGATYEILEQDIPMAVKGLQICLMVIYSMTKSSDRETTPIIWFIAKLVENKRLKSMQPELEDVAFLLKILIRVLGSACAASVVVLDSLAIHLPNIIQGTTALLDYVIDVYIDQALMGMSSQVMVVNKIGFWEKLLETVLKSVQQSVAEIDILSETCVLSESILRDNLQENLLKDVLAVAFAYWKETAANSVIDEICGMCLNDGQRERVERYLKLCVSIANGAFIYMSEKLEDDGSRMWQDDEFWPDCVAEGLVLWIFSGFDKLSLRPSDMFLQPREGGTIRHELVFNLFSAVNNTIVRVLKSWEDPSLDMESVDFDKPINFDPYQLPSLLQEFGIKLHSAALVIDALRQNNTTVSVAAHMALSDAYTRQCVESFLDDAIYVVIHMIENFSLSVENHAYIFFKSLDYLQDRDVLKKSLKEIGLDLQFALSPYFQERFRKLTGAEDFDFNANEKMAGNPMSMDVVVCGKVIDKIYEEKGLKTADFLKFLLQETINSTAKTALENNKKKTSVMANANITNWWKFGHVAYKQYHKQFNVIIHGSVKFLNPISFMMVGKGQALKPNQVRIIGGQMLLGPLYELSHSALPLLGSSRHIIEEVRSIRSKIMEIQSKIYAGQSAYQYMMESRQLKAPNPFKAQPKAITQSLVNKTAPPVMGETNRPPIATLPAAVVKNKFLSAAAMLTDEDVDMIMNILPKQIEEVDPVKIKKEMEPIHRQMNEESKIRTNNMKFSSKSGQPMWTQTDEEQYLANMESLFCEQFLLRSCVVVMKYDVKERLLNIQKIVQKALLKREKLTETDLYERYDPSKRESFIFDDL